MKHFKDICAQGDVLITRVNAIPHHAIRQEPDGNELIITHSETGHHHVMVLDRGENGQVPVEMYSDPDNPLVAWLKVHATTALEHRRSYDTHEAIMFSPGLYQVRRQREYTPDSFRRAQD